MVAATVRKTDDAVYHSVLAELKWNPKVDEADIGLSVHQGVVTLTGIVDSYAKKVAAQEAAHQVAGVLDVANEIQVRPLGRSARPDTEIAQAVRRALEWDVWIPHEDIHTTVIDGWVTLTGMVPYWSERQQAERLVRDLDGVRGVTNNVVIRAPSASGYEVEKAIEQALERRAEREAERIRISMVDGSASLTGRVHNWNEKQAVLGAVGSTLGVKAVEDHLTIDPYF